jgi:hypothetical protein
MQLLKQNPSTKDETYEFDGQELRWNLVKEFRKCKTCKKRFMSFQYNNNLSMEQQKFYSTCSACRGIIYNPYNLNQFMKGYYIPTKADASLSMNENIKYCNYISQTGGRYYYPNNMDDNLATMLANCRLNNQPFSMIENVHPTNPFKLFFDIEDDDQELPTTAKIVDLIRKHIKSLTPQQTTKPPKHQGT